MFDRTNVVYKFESDNLPHHQTIIHKRAPTDESIKLLKEMEEKVEDKVLKAMRLEDNTLKTVVHLQEDMMTGDMNVLLNLKLNGEAIKLLVSYNSFDLTTQGVDAVIKQMHKTISDRIAEHVLNEAIQKMPRSFFSGGLK
jgi:hypothetical protein